MDGVEKNALKKVLYFTAAWCPPCKMIAPIFENMSKAYDKTNFVKIDIDNCPEAAEKYGISSVPTFIFMNGATQMSQFTGANEATLKQKVEELDKI